MALSRLPTGFLGMLVATALIEGQIARNESVFIEKTPACWKYSFGKTREEAARAEILCLGSSLTKFGVHPRLIEKATGRSSYNLGVYGGRPASSYCLLEHVLATGHRPTAVVLDFYDGRLPLSQPSNPNHDLWLNQRFWEELLTLRECLDLSRQARDPDFFADTSLGIAIPSARARFEIRHEVSDAFAGFSGSSRLGLFPLYRNWNVNQGAQVMPVDGASELGEPAAAAPNPPLDNWANHRLLETYTRRFMDLTLTNGIRVFWILPPLTTAELNAEERSGFRSRYEAFAREMLRRNPQLTIIDARNSGYGPSLFYDPTHLNEEGMGAFSEDLGEIIAASLIPSNAKGNWLLMPPYRPRSLGMAFENLTQSRLAISTREATRK